MVHPDTAKVVVTDASYKIEVIKEHRDDPPLLYNLALEWGLVEGVRNILTRKKKPIAVMMWVSCTDVFSVVYGESVKVATKNGDVDAFIVKNTNKMTFFSYFVGGKKFKTLKKNCRVLRQGTI